jgi:hypothetical protein
MDINAQHDVMDAIAMEPPVSSIHEDVASRGQSAGNNRDPFAQQNFLWTALRRFSVDSGKSKIQE